MEFRPTSKEIATVAELTEAEIETYLSGCVRSSQYTWTAYFKRDVLKCGAQRLKKLSPNLTLVIFSKAASPQEDGAGQLERGSG